MRQTSQESPSQETVADGCSSCEVSSGSPQSGHNERHEDEDLTLAEQADFVVLPHSAKLEHGSSPESPEQEPLHTDEVRADTGGSSDDTQRPRPPSLSYTDVGCDSDGYESEGYVVLPPTPNRSSNPSSPSSPAETEMTSERRESSSGLTAGGREDCAQEDVAMFGVHRPEPIQSDSPSELQVDEPLSCCMNTVARLDADVTTPSSASAPAAPGASAPKEKTHVPVSLESQTQAIAKEVPAIDLNAPIKPTGADHDDIESLTIATRGKDKHLALLNSDDKAAAKLEVDFEPGRLGIKVESSNGLVTSVDGGEQADCKGVRVGMTVVSIQGEPYTTERLKAALVGNDNYRVIFAKATVYISSPCFWAMIFLVAMLSCLCAAVTAVWATDVQGGWATEMQGGYRNVRPGNLTFNFRGRWHEA